MNLSSSLWHSFCGFLILLFRVFWMLPHLVKDMLYCHHVNLVERVEVCASLLVLLP